MSALQTKALMENLDEVQDFVAEELEHAGCPSKAMMQISIAVEEIFVNIVSYAYNPEVGDAEILCSISDNPMQVTIQFLDHGKPFDPLAKPDADVTLSAEEREIGGLGIFMTKKLMDEVAYRYEDGKNVLTLKKELKQV